MQAIPIEYEYRYSGPKENPVDQTAMHKIKKINEKSKYYTWIASGDLIKTFYSIIVEMKKINQIKHFYKVYTNTKKLCTLS